MYISLSTAFHNIINANETAKPKDTLLEKLGFSLT